MSDEKFDNLGDLINHVAHTPQPHTILGERGNQEVRLTIRQIAECFMRGMLDGGTYYNLTKDNKLTDNIPTEKLEYHHLIDLIFEIEWLESFDPLAIVQNASCHIEKVLGIFPNVPKLERKDEP